MTMADFLAASAGTWLTRRAVHHLDHQDDEAGDSNLTIEPFDRSDAAVQSICESLGVASGQVVAVRASGGRATLKRTAAVTTMPPFCSMLRTLRTHAVACYCGTRATSRNSR